MFILVLYFNFYKNYNLMKKNNILENIRNLLVKIIN